MSYICESCGTEVPEGEEFIVDGQTMCKECFDEQYVQCSDCGALIHKDDAIYTNDGRPVCEDCYSDGYFTCEDCGEVFSLDEIVDVNAGWCDEIHVCQTCADSDYYRCDVCGGYINRRHIAYEQDLPHSNDIHYCCDDCSDNYVQCEECGDIIHIDDSYSNDDDDYRGSSCYHRAGIHSYGHKPSPIFGTTDASTDRFGRYMGTDLTFGVELECDQGEDPNGTARELCGLTDRLYCKHDGSLDYGYEIVTHPGTLAWHMNKFPWADVCRVSLDNGFKSHETSTCGLHIHIGKEQLGKNWRERNNVCGKLAALVDVLFPEIEQFSRRGRGGCDHWAARNNCVRGLRRGMDEASACEALFSYADNGRYHAVNVENEYTVELRFNRGTLKVPTIYACLQLASNLALFAKDHTVNECLDAKWDDVVHYREYEELTEYVNTRFKDFTPCDSDRAVPTCHVGDEMPISSGTVDGGDVSAYYITEPLTGCADKYDIVFCNRIPDDEDTDVRNVENHTGVHIPGPSTSYAWNGCNLEDSLHHSCNPSVSRGQWYVNRQFLSRAVSLINGDPIDHEAIRTALEAGFLPGDRVVLREPDRSPVVGDRTGTIIGFKNVMRGTIARVMWDGLTCGHSGDGLSSENNMWNVSIGRLNRV